MLTPVELRTIARERLQDAHILCSNGRYDGAGYICGYAVELALKARICETLNWLGFPQTAKEFTNYTSFKTHSFVVLLSLSGREQIIVIASEWSDKEPFAAVRLISDALVSKLNSEELSALSRVFVAPSQDPAVEDLIDADQAKSVERIYVSGFSFMGVPIRQIYVFRTQKTPRLNAAA
jgi:hypothetical protein